jgi:AraC-like DNA-binding protein
MCSARRYDAHDVPACETLAADEAARRLLALAESPCARAAAWRFDAQPAGLGGHRLTRRPFLKFFLRGSAGLRDATGRVVRQTTVGELAYFVPGTYANVHFSGRVSFFRATLLPDMSFLAWTDVEAGDAAGDTAGQRFHGFAVARRPSRLARELLERLERRSGREEATELWPVLCREWIDQIQEGSEGKRAEGRARRFEILRYLEDHAHEPINRKSVARALGLSVGHVSRVFTRHGEGSFNTTLSRLRLEHAKSLLARGDLPVCEIAPRCGFTSANYFAQAFRRAEGVNPASWRAREANRGSRGGPAASPPRPPASPRHSSRARTFA